MPDRNKTLVMPDKSLRGNYRTGRKFHFGYKYETGLLRKARQRSVGFDGERSDVGCAEIGTCRLLILGLGRIDARQRNMNIHFFFLPLDDSYYSHLGL